MATPPPRSKRSRLRVAGFRLWTVRGKTFEVPGGWTRAVGYRHAAGLQTT